MRIALVAPPFESVPPARYGGTERVIALLADELVRRGHDVTLFASGDSVTDARLVPTVERALWRSDPARDHLPYWTITVGEVYRRAIEGEFDIIHSHVDFQAFACAALATTPTVTTLHGRLDLPELEHLYERFPDAGVVSISNAQRIPLPHLNWLGTVYNAVDVDRLAFNPRGGEYLAFLGRISPEKGLAEAIEIARLAGLKLKIAAREPLDRRNDPSVRADWDYYQSTVKPELDAGHIEMVGEIGDREKPEFLGNARALLFPIDWPEPFGLVMAEALACGTPVIARRRGSVPEILKHGITAFIGETDEELARLCGQIDMIDREACRSEAAYRFSPSAMAAGYEGVYRRVLDSQTRTHEARLREVLAG